MPAVVNSTEWFLPIQRGDTILQLQEGKRKLVTELVADAANILKALSKPDVEYLLS